MTLIGLLFVAVPIKYLFGWMLGTAILGPVHGVVLIFYIVTLVENVAAKLIHKGEIFRFVIVCFVPFGPFLNDKMIAKKLDGRAV